MRSSPIECTGWARALGGRARIEQELTVLARFVYRRVTVTKDDNLGLGKAAPKPPSPSRPWRRCCESSRSSRCPARLFGSAGGCRPATDRCCRARREPERTGRADRAPPDPEHRQRAGWRLRRPKDPRRPPAAAAWGGEFRRVRCGGEYRPRLQPAGPRVPWAVAPQRADYWAGGDIVAFLSRDRSQRSQAGLGADVVHQ